MKRLALLFLLTLLGAIPAFGSGACPAAANYYDPVLKTFTATLSSLNVTGCWFIDFTGGADTNTGVDEAHPWKHVKGMVGAASTALAHTPVAGDGFIFKGGVTWDQTIGRWDLTGSGNSSNPIYYGIDLTWFTGGSFTRPIFSAGGVANTYDSNTQDFISGFNNRPINYVIWDDTEFTGLFLIPNTNPCSGGGGTTSCGYTNNFSGTNWMVLRTYTHNVGHAPWAKEICVNAATCTTQGNNSPQSVLVTSLSTSSVTNQFSCVGCDFVAAGFAANNGPYASGGFSNGGNNGFFHVTAVTTTTMTVSTSPVTEDTGYVTPGMTLVTEGPDTSAGVMVIGTSNIGNHLNGFAPGVTTAGFPFKYNVIDNQDGYGDTTNGPTNACCRGTLPNSSDTSLNVCRWIADCHNASNSTGTVVSFHDNRVDNLYRSFDPGDHENCYEENNTSSGSSTLFYGNYIECGDDPSSAVQSWSIGVSAGGNVYGFNNVFPQNSVALVNGSTTSSGGTIFIYQNTVACGHGTPTSSCVKLNGAMNYNVQNNFWITDNSGGGGTAGIFTGSTTGSVTTAPAFSITCAGGAQTNKGGVQICAPVGSGNGIGNLNYTQTYSYAPLDATAATTVGIGSDITSFCATITGLDAAAGVACALDTTYGPAYDSVNHKVTGLARTALARTLAAPRNGAYEQAAPTGFGGTLLLPGIKIVGPVTIQ